MKLEELERKAEATLQESRALAQKLDQDIELFASRRKDTVNQCLRAKIVQEIDHVRSKVLKRIEEDQVEIRTYPLLHSNKEVWIQAFFEKTVDRIRFDCDTVMMDKRYATVVASKMELKNPNVKYVTTEDFSKKIENLELMISQGKIDEVLGLKTGEVLWNCISGASLSERRLGS